MRSTRYLVGAVALLAVASTAPQAAQAQAYPTQDVHFVCAFAAGSGADIIVRYFSDKMRPLMGRSIIVENRVGAIGNLATEYVARSKPDGHVIYVTGASGVAANMHIFKNPSVDVGKALQIAATINKATMMLGVRADAPWKTAPELTAAMKLKGDKASYAIANPTSKVLGALYRERAGLQSVEVGYRTGADFLNDLYGGNIDYAIPDNIQATAQARAGRMRILAVGAATWIPVFRKGHAQNVNSKEGQSALRSPIGKRSGRPPQGYCTTSSFTFATPFPVIPSNSAAEDETSTTRPGTKGPRSLTRTVTDCPVATLVTRSLVPNGSVRCAAVSSFGLNASPLAVLEPLE